MAQESNKNIDQIFKDRLSDFGSVPSNDVWSGIDQSLNRQNRQKKYFIATFILAIITSGSIITFNYYGNKNTTQHDSIVTQREVQPLIKDIKKGVFETKEDDKTSISDNIDELSQPDNILVENATKTRKPTVSNPDISENESISKTIPSETIDSKIDPEVTIIDGMRPNTNSNQSIPIIKNTASILEKNDTLTLSIEFSNLERKLADKITIEQTIPTFLDINSINPIKSSHEYKYKIKKSQRKIIWTLKNIPAKGNKSSSGFIDYDVVVIKQAKESQLKSKEVVTFDYGYYRTKTTN